ncbi:MAG: transcription antitermination factor NusB [Chloroflexi bacterium RBG_16_64_32]|nr:MAG: transcription antitermination factor NusB [Chloroflexi bacterium RBG_16_64_32]
MAGKRRKARIVALKTLFEIDSVSHSPEQILERLREELPLPDDAAEFARDLVHGVIENRKRLDDIIRKNAPAWPLEQVAAIDRNILRLAIYEIVIDNRVPMRAAINEAIELAKEFGGEASPKFVNGVLGSVAATGTRR